MQLTIRDLIKKANDINISKEELEQVKESIKQYNEFSADIVNIKTILIKNPNIDFKYWCELTTEKTKFYALDNPAIDLWLLEDLNQWENMPKEAAEALLSIDYCSEFIKTLCRRAIENARKVVGPFTKYMFPVLRSVFPTMLAHDIVSV